LLQLRQNFRDNQQWAAADAIRDVLDQASITVQDDKNGSSWQLASKEG
jgi:cysteinyl-tRNA synthetase